MGKFRRLCLDLDDWNVVLGGSVEYYDDTQVGHTATVVAMVDHKSPPSQEEMLTTLRGLGWPQESLAFTWPQ